MYVKHRLAGPRVKWEWARRFGGVVVAFVALMGLLHSQDPRAFGVKGSAAAQSCGRMTSAQPLSSKLVLPHWMSVKSAEAALKR